MVIIADSGRCSAPQSNRRKPSPLSTGLEFGSRKPNGSTSAVRLNEVPDHRSKGPALPAAWPL